MEIGRLILIGVRDLSIRDIRFTGGEHLMRTDLEEVIACTRNSAADASASMTTNTVGVDKRVMGLVRAELTRLNISLDTTNGDHFARNARCLPSHFRNQASAPMPTNPSPGFYFVVIATRPPTPSTYRVRTTSESMPMPAMRRDDRKTSPTM